MSTLIFLGCTSTSVVRDEEKSYLHAQMALGHFKRGSYNRALGHYLHAEAEDPLSETVQNQLGLTYYMLGKPQEAVHHFDRALKLKPNFTEVKNNKSRVLIDIGKMEEARSLLQEVLEDLTYPYHFKARTNLGLLEFESGNFKLARDHFLAALKVDRESCQTYSYYGRSLYEMKDHRSAVPVFDRAVQLCKDHPLTAPLFYSAMNFYKLGNMSKAKARFSELVELYPLDDHSKSANSMLQIISTR